MSYISLVIATTILHLNLHIHSVLSLFPDYGSLKSSKEFQVYDDAGYDHNYQHNPAEVDNYYSDYKAPEFYDNGLSANLISEPNIPYKIYGISDEHSGVAFEEYEPNVNADYPPLDDHSNILKRPHRFGNPPFVSSGPPQENVKDFWDTPAPIIEKEEFYGVDDPKADTAEVAELLSSLAIMEDKTSSEADVKAKDDGTFNLSPDQIEASRSKGCSKDTVISGVRVSAAGKVTVDCSIPPCLLNNGYSLAQRKCQVFVERTCPENSWTADLFAVAETSFNPNLLLPLCCEYSYQSQSHVLRTVQLTPGESITLGETVDLLTGNTVFDLASRISENFVGELPEYTVTISRVDCPAIAKQTESIEQQAQPIYDLPTDGILLSATEIFPHVVPLQPLPPPVRTRLQARRLERRWPKLSQPRLHALKPINLKPILNNKRKSCCRPNCCRKACCAVAETRRYPKCFTGESLVTTPAGPKLMMDLRIGDTVLASVHDKLTWEPVGMFIHREPLLTTTFVRLETDSGESITLTDNHLIHNLWCHEHIDKTTWRLAYAKDVSIGSCLITTANSTDHDQIRLSKVIRVSSEEHTGIYAPLTSNGAIVVDSVLASCHSTLSDTPIMAALFNLVQYIESYFNIGLWNRNSIDNSASISQIVKLPKFTKFLVTLAKNVVPQMQSTHF